MSLPDFSGNFWAGVGLAAAVATALATGVSTFLSALWRWRDRPESEWATEPRHLGGIDGYGNPAQHPEVTVDLTNVGDGSAYKVTVSGDGLASAPSLGRGKRWEFVPVAQPLAVIHTSDSFSVIVEAESAEAWESASFTVSWWHAPTRRRRKWLGIRSAQLHERFYLRDLGENPAVASAPSMV